MPDHVHVLVEGLEASSDLRRLIARWKQKTGYAATGSRESVTAVIQSPL
jgi:hypothetical protein